MDPTTAEQILRLTCPPEPFIRPVDVLMDLEEATSAADAVYQVIQNLDSDWCWPSEERHLAKRSINVPDDENSEERQQDAEEDDEEYENRMRRRQEWPQVEAIRHAQWLRCAIITARALQHLQQCQDDGQHLYGKSGEYRYHYDPKKFYEYMWMCLNQGHGWRSWKTDPKMPPQFEPNHGAWYAKTSVEIIHTVLDRWHQGDGLGELVPVLTLEDLGGENWLRVRLGIDGKPLRE